MAKQVQEGDPELTPSILDIDYTPSHIAELLAAQTNDRERYALSEKMILELINKKNEYKVLVLVVFVRAFKMLEKQSMICSPDEYFSLTFQNKISKNRESRSTKWIFVLI